MPSGITVFSEETDAKVFHFISSARDEITFQRSEVIEIDLEETTATSFSLLFCSDHSKT